MSLAGAIVGFGRAAEEAHLAGWAAAGARIEAVADASAERRRRARRLLPAARVYPSLEALLASERGLAFADIATPPALHAPMCRAALSAGLHALCEKPLATTLGELEPLAALARRRGLALAGVHNWRHAPLFEALRRLLAVGAVGRVRHLELHTLRSRPAAAAGGADWRRDPRLAGGGILADHGSHAFYLAGWLLGEAPLRASVELRPGSRGTEVEATCLIAYPSATAVVHLSWLSPRRASWGLVYGSRGSVELLDDRLALRRADGSAETFAFAEPLSAASVHPDWFAGTAAEFLAAMDSRQRREGLLLEARDVAWLLGACRRGDEASR